MMSDPHNRASLQWQAFCYVAGELPLAEREAFEACLAEDQRAREAVAEAVELFHVIAAAESQLAQPTMPAARNGPTWRSRLAWVMVGGLASLLFVWLSLGPLETGWRGRQAGLDRPRELAAAWVETRQVLAQAGEGGGWLAGASPMFEGGGGAFLDSQSLPLEWQVEELSEDEIADTPSWMVVAVFHVGQKEPDGVDENPLRVPTRSEH